LRKYDPHEHRRYFAQARIAYTTREGAGNGRGGKLASDGGGAKGGLHSGGSPRRLWWARLYVSSRKKMENGGIASDTVLRHLKRTNINWGLGRRARKRSSELNKGQKCARARIKKRGRGRQTGQRGLQRGQRQKRLCDKRHKQPGQKTVF